MSPKEAAIHEHQPKPGELLDDREALAVQLAERIALDPHTVDDDFFAGLREQFSDEEIVEMAFACSIFNWGNKFNITMQMDADEISEYPKDMAYRQEALT
ncbi:MAG: carboxymuconolactone decarboxylase family protein [Acidimicrobiia bacterium]